MKKRITEKGRDCSKCDTFKDWLSFSKNKRNSTGHNSVCKACCSVNGENYVARQKKTQAPEPGFSYLAQCFYLSKRC
jgi:hypothetical protein